MAVVELFRGITVVIGSNQMDIKAPQSAEVLKDIVGLLVQRHSIVLHMA
jgi:hypothetical protein